MSYKKNKVLRFHKACEAASVSPEFFKLKALCDEILANLSQAKALMECINAQEFLVRQDIELLKNYFYALDTVMDSALAAKDQICDVLDYTNR